MPDNNPVTSPAPAGAGNTYSALTYMVQVLTATLILMSVAFYNGYALVYWDSASYLHTGFEKMVPRDRSVVYGLFLNLFSAGRSLWPVLFVQNLVTAFTLLEMLRLFMGSAFRSWIYLSVIAGMTFFTGIGWFSNQVMPDFLTPLLILLVFLSLFNENAGTGRRVTYALLVLGCCISHFSHLLIGLGAITLLLIYCFIRRRHEGPPPVRRFVPILLVMASGFIVLPLVNFALEGRFLLSKSTQPFLIGHLVENGVMGDFLSKHCERPEFASTQLCQCRDNLPADLSTFLWQKDGCFDHAGGWAGSEREFAFFSREILGRPSYFMMNAGKTLISSFVQLFRHRIGYELIPYLGDSQVHMQIGWRFSHELNTYVNSRQNSGLLNNEIFPQLNTFLSVINLASVVFLLIAAFSTLWQRLTVLSRRLIVFTVLALAVNALVVTAFNAPNDRYQARVMFLLPFAIMLCSFTERKAIRDFCKGGQATRPGLSPRNDFQPL